MPQLFCTGLALVVVLAICMFDPGLLFACLPVAGSIWRLPWIFIHRGMRTGAAFMAFDMDNISGIPHSLPPRKKGVKRRLFRAMAASQSRACAGAFARTHSNMRNGPNGLAGKGYLDRNFTIKKVYSRSSCFETSSTAPPQSACPQAATWPSSRTATKA